MNYDPRIDAIRHQGVREGLYEPLPGNALEVATAGLGAAERDFAAASAAYAQTTLMHAPETGSSRKWFLRSYTRWVRAKADLRRLEGGE